MSQRTKYFLKLAAGALCLAVGGGLLLSRVREASQVGEEGAQVWFYDLSEQQLYPVARETFPPHKGIGGPKGDGVRALVTAPKGEANSPAQRRIAYLETYTPELKKLLEDVSAARATRRPYAGKLPARDSDYFGTNTLVRRPSEPTWHAAASEEGRRIMAEWREWREPDGQPLGLRMP